MWLYLIWDLVKTLQRNDLYRTIIFLFTPPSTSFAERLQSDLSSQKESFHFKKLTYCLSMASWACVEYQFSDLRLLSPTNGPFFQSDPHAVICNKFAITDKPLHKHDSNKYQSKAFVICNQRSVQTRFVVYVNKTYWSLLINSTSTAPIRSCVHGWTQFFKIVGFLRQTFPSLPPTHHFSFLLLSQLSRWIRAKRLLCRL